MSFVSGKTTDAQREIGSKKAKLGSVVALRILSGGVGKI